MSAEWITKIPYHECGPELNKLDWRDACKGSTAKCGCGEEWKLVKNYYTGEIWEGIDPDGNF